MQTITFFGSGRYDKKFIILSSSTKAGTQTNVDNFVVMLNEYFDNWESVDKRRPGQHFTSHFKLVLCSRVTRHTYISYIHLSNNCAFRKQNKFSIFNKHILLLFTNFIFQEKQLRFTPFHETPYKLLRVQFQTVNAKLILHP